jgi:hypothetical protein
MHYLKQRRLLSTSIWNGREWGEREEQKASATLGKKEEKRFIYTHILPTYHVIPISVRTPSILLSTSKMELLKVKTGRQMVEITANMLLLLYWPVMRSFLFLFLIPSQVRQSHSHPSSLYAVVELFLFYYYYYFGVFFFFLSFFPPSSSSPVAVIV